MVSMHLRRSRLWGWIKKLPRRRHIRGTALHRWAGDHIFLPDFWKPERKLVAAGIGLGLFWAMMPIPFQMVPAGLSAFFARVNIPAAITSVWVTNPVTWPLILYWQYRLGAVLLGEGGLGSKTLALLLGCGITGIAAGVCGWAICQILWPLLSRSGAACPKTREGGG
jgi:hypothetical protein